MFFPYAKGKLNPLRGYGDTGRTNSCILQVHIKKFYIFFSKNSHFFNFQEKSKLTLRCTAPIYVLSICKRKIKSLEGLRRYRPYKLMNIASPYKKFYIFSKNSHLFNFREKSKLTLRCTAPIYVLSMCKRKIKSVEGLRRYRPYKLVLKSVDTRTARQTDGRTDRRTGLNTIVPRSAKAVAGD